MNIPDLSSLDIDGVQLLINAASSEQMPLCDGDFLEAYRRAKNLYPSLWTRLSEVTLPDLVSATSIPPVRNDPANLPPVSRPGDPNFSQLRGRHTANTGVVAGLGNDMSTANVRKTYVDAFNKHMKENPDCDPLDAHRKVLAAHPALAAALQAKSPSTKAAPTEAASAVGNESTPTALGNSKDEPDADSPFLMISTANSWALA